MAINIFCLPRPMSEEQLKAFIDKVKTDTSLQEKLKTVPSPEAAIEIAKEAGFLITVEDIQSVQSEAVELSDDELEGVSGGAGMAPVYSQFTWCDQIGCLLF